MKTYRFHNKNLEELPVILKNVVISGNICGEFVEFVMEQTFENIGEDNIEAIYSFPIPDTGIITGLEVSLGGRSIKAMVEEKAKAKELWDKALEEGVNTLNLEEDSDNIYNITIGNILPNEVVKIKISYMDQLTLEDEVYKLIIPEIEGPIGINRGLKENSSDYDVSINLLIESFERLKIWSPSHDIEKEYGSQTLVKVTLKKGETLNREFVLLMEEETEYEFSAMSYSFPKHIKDESIVYLKVFPDMDEDESKKPVNYLFLMDISNDMGDNNLSEIKTSLALGLRNLNKEDRFNILAFHDELNSFSDEFLNSSEENVDNAVAWLKKLNYGNGADISEALKWALNQGNDSVIILFTNDEAENEEQILRYIRENVKENRIFPIGVADKTNKYFIREIAAISGGRADFIKREEKIGELILRQFNRITGPQIDVREIYFGGETLNTYPRTIEYIYDIEPFSIFAKIKGITKGPIIIKGFIGDKPFIQEVPIDSFELKENAYLIEKVWIRKRIEILEERMDSFRGIERDAMESKVVELSKSYGIISSKTSFIMTEVLEDPLLGIAIQKILPLDVSEETMESLSYGYFLDAPGFLYKISKNNNNILDNEKLYSKMAENQRKDGSICVVDASEKEKIKSTLKALIAFASCKQSLGVYVKIINRAIAYVLNYINENSLDRSEQLLYLTAFRALALKNTIVKDKTGAFKAAYDKLLSMINEPQEIRDVNDIIDLITIKNNL
ncbi:VIT and vWA domain-containing protein [Clostridium cadaveris]|uniref:VIT and vWA domain-containing protein n=1 Tax=Clostridium cadaveris TaxID=1529 RepID=UPI0015B38241|nr:VIT and VWA domain-containing protein [Clostridium cadaveris]NWK10836.1 VWA domain-containing protein [Clostridium cadaveris]